MEKNGWELKWSDVLAVGVPQMDEEHKAFIAQVNALTQAVLDCRDKATIGRLMDTMLAAATDHFRNEEQLLLDSDYPEWSAHAEKHLQLIERLGRMKREFDTPAISFMGALKGMHINQLLIEHLLTDDMKYRDYLKARANGSSGAACIDYALPARAQWSWPRAGSEGRLRRA